MTGCDNHGGSHIDGRLSIEDSANVLASSQRGITLTYMVLVRKIVVNTNDVVCVVVVVETTFVRVVVSVANIVMVGCGDTGEGCLVACLRTRTASSTA